MGQQCQYLAHGTWPCQRKKRKIKNNILVRIFIFFSLKLAFDMMIFYCRLGEGRDKRFFFWVYIQVFSFSLVYNFFFSCFKKSSHFCDLCVLLFIKRFIFRIRVSGVRVSIMVWLIVANIRGDGCRSACLRIRRLLHGFCKIQLHLELQIKTNFSLCSLKRITTQSKKKKKYWLIWQQNN